MDYEKKSDKSIEEAAYKYSFDSRPSVYGQVDVIDAFKAGAEWQKEQDQPITGNSLEQEWLRYVDRKKKECRGELPSLGEYGWLQIARHFAEWQKSQMLKDAYVESLIVEDGRIELGGNPLPCLNPIILLPYPQFKPGDKVRIIIVKED